MPVTLEGKLVVALSSRALFDFEEENRVFVDRDDSAYMAVQLDRLEQAARPGAAFPLVKKLLAFNSEGLRRVEVVILSRNDPVSGLRVFRSAEAAGLSVERGVFTRGRPPYHYLNPLGAHLFLSADDGDVRAALAAGFPAARVYPQSFVDADRHPDEVRIAFDGDAVLFSDEAERVYQRDGLPAFVAHERAVRTLMDWNIDVDEAMFLGGLDKGAFLKEFQPDFFFDDQAGHCESAAAAGPAGHVVSGVKNG